LKGFTERQKAFTEHLYGGQSSLPDVSAASEREGMDMIVVETLDLEKDGDVDSSVSLSPGFGRQAGRWLL
jgi:hypothetical protein